MATEGIKRARPAAKKRKKTTLVTGKTRSSTRAKVDSASIKLVQGRGTPGHGGDPEGSYWHIYSGDKRAGHVFINRLDHPYLGTHFSLQIHINKDQRGRGIGRVAYRLACEQSGHEAVYAHMRKSNTASKRAAEAAGFAAIEDDRIPQLSMVWHRSGRK